jgi:hypothetical protein
MFLALAGLVGCHVSVNVSSSDDKGTKSEAEVWPTEEEAKAAIHKLEYSIHASETNRTIWHVKDLRHEVKSVEFGKQTAKKVMTYTGGEVTVYPAKIRYTRITDYTDKDATRTEEGENGTWYFFRDAMGEWDCRYGD